MIVPVPATQSPAAQDPARDLRVAIRLLAGKDCERDAAAAQVLLLNVAEAGRDPFARDADRILKAGTDRGWFRDKAPAFFELERIATESTSHPGPGAAKQQNALIIAGLLAVVLGAGIFFAQRTGETEAFPVIILMAIVMLLGLMIFVKAKRK